MDQALFAVNFNIKKHSESDMKTKECGVCRGGEMGVWRGFLVLGHIKRELKMNANLVVDDMTLCYNDAVTCMIDKPGNPSPFPLSWVDLGFSYKDMGGYGSATIFKGVKMGKFKSWEEKRRVKMGCSKSPNGSGWEYLVNMSNNTDLEDEVNSFSSSRHHSYVWDYFDRIPVGPDGVKKASCNGCGKLYSAMPNTGTSNMKRHIPKYPRYKIKLVDYCFSKLNMKDEVRKEKLNSIYNGMHKLHDTGYGIHSQTIHDSSIAGSSNVDESEDEMEEELVEDIEALITT
ncbi:hypothetical protein L1987_07785 [Smallanthus sonchifolius]|uniref:Uncharacterized protein n=1 Tax=Smallanthus sonchifolius TaxID=185202 RepID=A0ACB9JKK2_9ASTR|nr:hypothetical protein L1987_07785 [Smallanthus sonchifolius]